MRYNEYGKTGIALSVIGCGGTRFDSEKSIEENADRLVYAYSKGVNHFDSAPGYDHYRNEDIIASAFSQMDRNKIFTSTKNAHMWTDTAEKAYDGICRSLDKLRIDKFDFYYVWQMKSMNDYETVMRPGGQYEGVLKAKRESLVDHIVFSSHMPGYDTVKILDTGYFEGVLLNMNVLNFPFTMVAAEHAKKLGLGVGAMSPLMGGVIPKNEDKLSFLSVDGKSPIYTATKFICQLDEVDFAYFAHCTKDEIDFACDIVDNDMDKRSLDEYRKLISEGIDKACTGCLYCADACPKDIGIPAYMQFYNNKYIFNMPDDVFKKRFAFARDWMILASRKSNATECIACGACEHACTQHINIIERMAEFAAIEREL
ncbi:MAG: aldo/keto reductase [Eubacteriales bacterium]